MQTQTILDRINTLPRIKLARLNTPFEEMPRLRAAIADSMDADPNANKCAVPRLFIKRDDTTGFAFGGNKARHMEFLFAHLIDRGIDTIVNINHYDSNNARLVSAACAKTGMKCHWVAFDMLDKPITGKPPPRTPRRRRHPPRTRRTLPIRSRKTPRPRNQKRTKRHHPLRQPIL